MAGLDRKEMEWAIAQLEQEESSKSGYILLSALYTIRDHLDADPVPPKTAAGYSRAAAQPLGLYGESEFLEAAAGKDSAAAWRVMDELMETLRVVEPRVYRSVMRKMEEI